MINFRKRLVPAFLIMIIFGLAGCNNKGKSQSTLNRPDEPKTGKPAPALPTKGVTWINSNPKTLNDLQGNVVLIDFWEYTCINCIRSLPFEKKLYKRYHNNGFEILGIHAPEFPIAYKVDNLRKAVKQFNIPWPVAQDKYFFIWKKYNSHTWPNYFLIGPKSNLGAHWSGEGHDTQIEQTIQKLLAQSSKNFDASKYPVESKNWFGPACGNMTPETYVGRWYGRGALQDQGGYKLDVKVRKFNASQMPKDGHFVLNGKWQTAKYGVTYRGIAQNHAPQSLNSVENDDYPSITLKYHAREVYSVMNVSHNKNKDQPVKVYITQDGHYLSKKYADADTQFDDQGRSYIMVNAPRMYYLVLNPKGKDGTHVLTLWPAQPGWTINSYTFGNNCSINFAHLYSYHGGLEWLPNPPDKAVNQVLKNQSTDGN